MFGWGHHITDSQSHTDEDVALRVDCDASAARVPPGVEIIE